MRAFRLASGTKGETNFFFFVGTKGYSIIRDNAKTDRLTYITAQQEGIIR